MGADPTAYPPPSRFRLEVSAALNVATNAILGEMRTMVESGDTSDPTHLSVVWQHAETAKKAIFVLADEYADRRIEEARTQMEILDHE